MRANIKLITDTLKCDENHAEAVERYIDEAALLDWSEDSARVIRTMAKAVHDHLMRGKPAKKTAKPKAAPAPAPAKTEKPAEKPTSNPFGPDAWTPKPGTKIAHARQIYLTMLAGESEATRQDVISAMSHSMQIEKHAAAGYYQTCKKRIG